MSCGSPAGSEGFAPPLGQGGAPAQEMETFAAQIAAQTARATFAVGAFDIRFSATDYQTVAWGAGGITDSDGNSYLISAGSTTVTSLTYIYFDTALSQIALQTTTNPASTVGAGRLLLVVAAADADTSKLAHFLSISTPDFSNVWTGSQIAVNTLTAAHVASLVFTGKTANFDTGTVGGWAMASGKLSSGLVEINATNQQILFGSATAPLTGTGIFLGKDGSDYEFRCGNPSTDYMHWDGSSLTVKVGNDVSVTGGGGTYASFVRRSVSAAGNYTAFQGIVQATTASPGSISGIESWAQADHTSGNLSQVFGLYATGRTTAAGTATDVFGIRASSAVSGGAVTNAYGIETYADVYSTTGVTAAYGVWASVVARSTSAGTIGFAACLYASFAKDGASTATITNAYGLYVATVAGATTNYAIKTNGGKVDLGDTLTVAGISTFNANVLVPGAFGAFYSSGNVALCDSTGSFGGGTDVVFVGDASTVPTTNPASGGILYSQGGALKWRGSAGTVTTIAPA